MKVLKAEGKQKYHQNQCLEQSVRENGWTRAVEITTAYKRVSSAVIYVDVTAHQRFTTRLHSSLETPHLHNL
jgi:hypothetical protein